MAGGGNRGTQGRNPNASTIAERERKRSGGAVGVNPKRIPAAPRHLTQEAKKEWRRKVRELMDAGLWENVYTDSVAMYCVAQAQYLKSLAMLNGPVGLCPNCDPAKAKDRTEGWKPCPLPSHSAPVQYGEFVKGRFGAMVKSPYMGMKKEAEALMVRLNSEFGMTLASHSRLPAGKGAKERPRPPLNPGPTPESVRNDPRELLKMQTLAGAN